jgi:hypothetical protein
MSTRAIDLLMDLGTLVALAFPWIMYYRHWSTIPEGIVRRDRKGRQRKYHRWELLFVQGFLTICVLSSAVIFKQFRVLVVSLHDGELLVSRLTELTTLWIALLCAVLPYYNLHCLQAGREMSRRARVVGCLLAVLGLALLCVRSGITHK